jgi:myo-inositol 2-dehydrogenase/D-chiro-inositol 1-dehydrogenase
MSRPNPASPGSSRRTFLKTTATAATVAAAVTPLIVPQGVRAAGSEVVKFGLIGCGGRGTGAGAQALSANPSNHLTAIGDLWPEPIDRALVSYTKQHPEQVKVTPDTRFTGLDAFKKVIDSGVDVVLLTTPPAFRWVHFQYAVEKNKHVFAEKPLCVDAAGYRAVTKTIEESKRKNLGFVDGFCWRYSIGERATFPRVHQGAIGDILSIYSHYNASQLWMKPRQPNWSDTEWQLRNWLYFTWLSGDHIVEQAVHTIDKVAWAMKDEMPARAWATGGRQQRVDPAFGHIWDHFAVVYEWANGARAHVYCRQQDQVNTGVSDHFVGTKGVCDITSNFSPKNGGPSYVIREHGDKGPGWRLTDVPKDYPSAYQVEHDELFASIRDGKPINAGLRVPNSAMMAVMGRMAGYSGDVITWEEAITSTEDGFPKNLDLSAAMPTPPVAVPGKTELQWLKDLRESRQKKNAPKQNA